jgi:nicotinate phosphoribosyltransferase
MTKEITRFVEARTDKYFNKSKKIAEKFGDVIVTGGAFLRRDVIVAIQPALDFIAKICPEAKVKRLHEEGTLVPSETKLFEISGPFTKLVELETLILQNVGTPCVSAYNAYHMCSALPTASFMDMAMRHLTGDDMARLVSYGASVGSRVAKLQGAKGFVGSSTDLTAPFYGAEKGIGTMPHAIIGYADGTLESVKMYIEANPTDTNIVALVDYFGQETTDSVEVAEWFFATEQHKKGRKLGFRLDTHGGRFAEGLDYQKSVNIINRWLHTTGEYDSVRKVLNGAYDMASNETIDKVRKILFGTGVSAANIINMREQLDQAGFRDTFIVASSGFNLFKCRIMAKVNAPITMVGTGSFIPETMSETFATLDYYKFDDRPSIKVGREWLMK